MKLKFIPIHLGLQVQIGGHKEHEEDDYKDEETQTHYGDVCVEDGTRGGHGELRLKVAVAVGYYT